MSGLSGAVPGRLQGSGRAMLGGQSIYADPTAGTAMDADDIAGKIAFLAAEQDLAVRFGIPAEALVPLFFSLRFGGDYSYADASVRTISILKKTTVYDADQQQGYTQEEIFLFINPVLAESEGTVHRMEKCGDEAERLLVTRPYRVRVRADRLLKLTVNPLARTITPGELSEKEMVFVAPTAYDVAHELEHLQSLKITGAGIWELRFV